MDCSPPRSSVHGVFQARVLEWGAIAFSETSYYSCLIPTSTEECWGHLPVLMVPRKGSVLSTVTSLLTPISWLWGQSPATGTVRKALRPLWQLPQWFLPLSCEKQVEKRSFHLFLFLSRFHQDLWSFSEDNLGVAARKEDVWCLQSVCEKFLSI